MITLRYVTLRIPQSGWPLGRHRRFCSHFPPSLSVLSLSYCLCQPHTRPFAYVVLPSFLLSSSCSFPWYRALQYSFGESWWPCDVTVKFQFSFLHCCQEVFIRPDYSMDAVDHLEVIGSAKSRAQVLAFRNSAVTICPTDIYSLCLKEMVGLSLNPRGGGWRSPGGCIVCCLKLGCDCIRAPAIVLRVDRNGSIMLVKFLCAASVCSFIPSPLFYGNWWLY